MQLFIDDAKRLVEKLRTDKGLRERIHEIPTIEKRLSFIHSLGYKCNSDTIKNAFDNYG